MSARMSDTLDAEDAGQGRQGDQSVAAPNMLDLLVAIAGAKRFILLFTSVMCVIAIVIVLLLPLRYTATTWVVPPQQSSGSSALLSQLGGAGGASLAALAGGSLGVKNPDEIYIAMFHSRTVEDAMIARFDLLTRYKVNKMSFARMIFEDRSTAVAGTRDGVIRVTMEASSPKLAADMANAYVEEVRKLSSTLAVTEAAQRRLFFDKQLEDAKNNLATAEENLKRTELSSGLVQPESQSRALIESAARIQGQIAATELQIESMKSYATPDNPRLVVAQNQLVELRSQLQKLTGNSGTDADLFVPKGKIPQAALEYVRRYRDVKYRETIFEAVARQFEVAKLDEAKEGGVIQIMDAAIPPDKKSYPKRGVVVILTGLLSLLFSSLFVLLRYRLQLMSADREYGPKLAMLRESLRLRRTR